MNCLSYFFTHKSRSPVLLSRMLSWKGCLSLPVQSQQKDSWRMEREWTWKFGNHECSNKFSSFPTSKKQKTKTNNGDWLDYVGLRKIKNWEMIFILSFWKAVGIEILRLKERHTDSWGVWEYWGYWNRPMAQLEGNLPRSSLLLRSVCPLLWRKGDTYSGVGWWGKLVT